MYWLTVLVFLALVPTSSRVLLVRLPGRRASSAAAVVVLHRHGALRVADLGLDVRPVLDVLVEVADVAADFLRWALATFTRWFHGFVCSFVHLTTG